MVRFTWMVCLRTAHVNDHVARTGTRASNCLIYCWPCGGLLLPEFRLGCHPLDLNHLGHCHPLDLNQLGQSGRA